MITRLSGSVKRVISSADATAVDDEKVDEEGFETEAANDEDDDEVTDGRGSCGLP